MKVTICFTRKFFVNEMIADLEPVIKNLGLFKSVRMIQVTPNYLASQAYLDDLHDPEMFWMFSLETYVGLVKKAPNPEKVFYLAVDGPYRLDVDYLAANVDLGNGDIVKMKKLEYLQKCRLILNYSQLYDKFYEQGGYRIIHFPLGYFPKMEELYLKEDRSHEKYDVFFAYTTNSERRQQILKALAKRCYVCHGVFAGKQNKIIASSKIALNVYFAPEKKFQPFDVARIFPLMSKQKFIVTEESAEPEKDREFAPFMEIVPYDKVAETTLKFLSKGMETERKRRAEAGYQYLKEKYDLNQIFPGKEIAESLEKF